MSESLEIKFQLLETQKELAKAKKHLEAQEILLLRWNKAASAAGMAGSEFHNDPERVFDRVVAQRRALNNQLRKTEVMA